MKFYTTQVFTLLLFGTLIAACGASQGVSKSSSGRTIDYAAMSTLADALRVQSGLQVVGSANNIKVTIRGVNSSRSSKSTTFVQNAAGSGPRQAETTTLSDVEPLFVVDKTIVGNSYAAASTTVNVQDITSIKVLKSYAETNSYGETGKNGVILITTRLAPGN